MSAPESGDEADIEAPRARPYTTTAGRTEATEALDVASLVRTTGRYQPKDFPLDHADALALCAIPTSVAEIAANLAQPVMVTKVLLSDLIESGAVAARPLSYAPPEIDLLERLLHGLQKL